MNFKKMFKVLTTVATAAALTVCANAAFTKTNTYKDGQFTDVKSNAWYAKEVASAYELGFMNGTDDTVFSPDGNVTVAQGITMAARVNASYNGKEIPAVQGTNWYDMYVKYAVSNGIMKEDQFDSMTRNITRAEMATLFADAVPASEYKAINNVVHIPDVIEGNDYAKKILMLYNAGIVFGSDDFGTFNPDSDIKRSESAAIINRVALPENRVKGTLKEYNFRDSYVFLYFDGNMNNSLTNHQMSIRENIEAGWVIDNRGGTPRTGIEEGAGSVVNISKTQPSSLFREFNKIDKDIVVAEFQVKQMVDKGAWVKFCDIDVKDAFSFTVIDGKWNVLGKDGKFTPLAAASVNEYDNFRLIMDIPAGKVKTYINNAYCGEYDMLSDNIASYRLIIDETGDGVMTPGKMNFTANYGVYENFDVYGIEEVYGWKTEGGVSVNSDREIALKDKSSVAKTFAPIETKYIAEMLAIFPEGENAGFKVLSGSTAAVDFVSKDGKLYANGEVVYEKLTKNMWYRLRVEANPSTGKAEIVINGRELATVALGATEPVDSIVIYSNGGNAKVDNIKVYGNIDHYDYVPAPVAKASFDDYIVAMNICNLWYNDGSHYGWACITPYDENKPVLGYYDEGSRESADWEVKYMVEGGIDIQAVCWYAKPEKGPIKTTNLSFQLNEGLQHSKYQDYMKYCLIWEAGSGTKFNAEQFRTHVIPYWFENYFLDENYAVIDNKLLLHVYALDSICSDKYFGNFEKAKAEFEYLEEVARSYGFDGMLYVSNASINTIEKAGLDAYAAYHWGAPGYQYQVNVDKNVNLANEAKTAHVIPTISVGYSDFAWRNMKQPLMTPEDWAKSHEWVKSTYIPKYAEKGTWEEKMVWVSTWNEYGEGTYIMPCEGLNGFSYLDVLRDKYTNLPKELPHIIPNEAQLERINHFYPQYARLLRFQGYYENPTNVNTKEYEYEVVKTIVPSAETIVDINGVDNVKFENGVMSGVSNKDDFNFNVKGIDGLNLKEIAAIRVNLEIPNGKHLQVFYGTDAEPGYSENKSMQVKYTSTAGGLQPMLCDFHLRSGLWRGTLTALRIDPCNGNGAAFKLGAIEFLKIKENEIDAKYAVDNKLFVNTLEAKSIILPERNNGVLVYPFDPETAIDHLLYSFFEWDHETRTIKLTANNHVVTFKDGSDKYTVDGVEKKLGYTVYSVDGIPMIDFKALSEALGYTYKEEGTNVYIETPELEIITGGSFTQPGQWDFSGFDSDGWKSGNMNFTANGEYLSCENLNGTNTDPNMSAASKIKFPARQFKEIEVRVRYKYEAEKPDQMTFYYITSLDSSWNETKTVRQTLKSTDSKGEWEVYTFDVKPLPNWNGLITGFRFDPFNKIGSIDIDYIRLIEDPEYDPELYDTSGIQNGTAELPGIQTFYSGTAKVTIEEDAQKPGNHVYRFTGPDKKSWTYAVHDYPFETGKKYEISFDARGVSDSKGNKVRMNLAVNIQYPAADGTDHHAGSIWLEADGSWAHFNTIYVPGPMTGNNGIKFSCYITPTGEDVSDTFELDNISVKEVKD